MPGYTIKNLMELDDATGGSVPGLEARFARSHIESEHLGLTYLRYAPDSRTPFGHSHREQEEVYVVSPAPARMKLDDEIFESRPGTSSGSPRRPCARSKAARTASSC